MATRAQQEATERYNSKAYDEIKLRVPKGRKQLIDSTAQDLGFSLNDFINRALAAAFNMDMDGWKYDYLPGQSQTQPEHERIIFTVSPGFRQILSRLAAYEDQSLNDYIATAVADKIRNMRPKEERGNNAATPAGPQTLEQTTDAAGELMPGEGVATQGGQDGDL